MSVVILPPSGEGPSAAVFSEDMGYRYLLSRTWVERPRRRLGVIALNPSTADHRVDDPTIRRCIALAKRMGMGGVDVANLFARRATDPRELGRVHDPVGTINDSMYASLACTANMDGTPILVAWGEASALRGPTRRLFLDRAKAVEKLLAASGARLICLGYTSGRQPRHPLYIADSVTPIGFAPWLR